MAGTASQDRDDALNVGWIDIVSFIRQLSHDLRNHLNAAELQAAYVGELATDPELKSEIKRLREIMSQLSTALQKLSSDVGAPKADLIPYGAAEFVEDLRKQIEVKFPEQSAAINWNVQLENTKIDVDPQLLPQALIELFANAFHHERGADAITVTASIDNGRFVFELREPKTRFELPTENWGREPLRGVSRGHYGLGLSRARRIVQAHNGELRAHYDSAAPVLVTTITMPLSEEK